MSDQLPIPVSELPAVPAPGQPILFADEQWQRLEQLVPIAAKYQHTAKGVTKDEELCFAICEKLVQGWSERSVARHFHVSRHTIRAMMEELEKAGKLAPLKQRLSHKLGLVAELSLDEQVRALRAGTVQANVLPIMTGVSLDKKAGLDASAAGDGPALAAPLTAEDVRQAFAKLRPAQTVIDVEPASERPATDSQSTGEPPNA